MKNPTWKIGNRFNVHIDYAQVTTGGENILQVPMRIKDKRNNRLYRRVGHHVQLKSGYSFTFVSWYGRKYNVNEFLEVK